MASSTCLRRLTVSSHVVILLNAIAVLLTANETFSCQAYVLSEPVTRRICNPDSRGRGFDSRLGRHCATTVGKLTFLATMWHFVELLRSLVSIYLWCILTYTLYSIKNVVVYFWSSLWGVLMYFNNFYISTNRNEWPLQVSYLVIYFLCNVNMMLLYVSHHTLCSQ